MKKVLISVTTLFGGGAERVVSVWANELSDLGYEVSLLIYGRSDNEYYVSSSVNICTIADTYQKYKQLGYVERLCRMRRIIKNVKPDVIINFLPRMQIWMMFASLGLNAFKIETVRVSPWEVCKNNRIEKLLWKSCFKIADAVILQTEEQGEFFIKKIQHKSVVIPNPIAPQYCDNYKKEYSEKAVNYVGVGRITPQKNYPMMIRAFKIAQTKYPDIKLSIFGTGDEKYINELLKLVHSLELDGIVIFEGRSNQISEELCKRDAFIMTSNYEGMPNALVEAMASGLVCISTNCRTGPKDLIENEKNGLLVDVNNTEAVADAICQIAEMNSARMASIGAAARDKVMALCSKENSRNKLVELIENAIIK